MNYKSLCFSLLFSLLVKENFGRYFFCRDPGTPDNADRMTQFGTVYRFYIGSTIEYKCMEGYAMRGSSTITCMVLITSPFVIVGWQPGLPQCTGANTSLVCPHLTSPRNGKVSVSGRAAGDIATYTCQTGFMVSGPTKRECQSTGVWSNVEPVCSTVDCGTPEDIANGMITILDTVYRSVITYSCNYGYILIGKQNRTCQENGVWSEQSPRCAVMDCGSPGFPDNGDTVVKETTYNSTVTHLCNEGYILTGDKIRTCHGNGTWSGIFPKCKPISCKNISVPQNGLVNSTSTALGTVVHFTCNDGYYLLGDSPIECQKNGLWSGILPLCILIINDCGDPGTPKHGVKFYTNTTLGSVISFSCLSGYVLVGSSLIECNRNGRWSDVLPQCQPIDCGDPGTPPFGERELDNTTYQSTVNYTCLNSSYELVGSLIRICLVNGSWSGMLPNCVLNCESPEPPTFGAVNYSNSTTVGSNATYSCQEGYRLVGVAERTCLDNETWSGVVPTCTAITHCDKPDIPVFGVTTYYNYSIGSVITYDCISGYVLMGSTMRTCLVNGTWSGIVPVCNPIDCGDPGTPSNGTRILNGTGFLSTVEYSCDDGYLLIGSSTRECLDNGSWSGVISECKLIDCGIPELPNPAGVLFYSNSTVGSTVTYSCIVGYRLVGEAERVCLSNGTWSDSVPSCVTVTDCGFPEIPLLGLADTQDVVIGSVTTYSCIEGYTLLGNQNRTCLPNGEWSGETPICVHV